MPVDAEIPLQVNTQLDVGKLMSMAQLSHQFRQELNADKTQNALKQVMMAPDAFDPQTNTLSPNTLKRVMQIDPATGIKLQGDMLETQMKQAQANHYKTEAGKMAFDASTGIAGAAYDAYTDAKSKGASEADAIQAGTKVRNAGLQNSGGLLSDADVEKGMGMPFDPEQAKTFAGLNKEWSGLRTKSREDAERERHDAAVEANAARGQNIRVETGQNAKWQVLTDPKTNTQYRYNPETGQSTTLDASKTYSPGGAQRLGGGGSSSQFTPEMGGLMASLAEHGISLPTGFRSQAQQASLYKGLLERNPGRTPDQIANLLKTGQIEFGAQKKETQTAAGIAGKVEVASNELKRFIPLVRNASADLDRSNIKSLNQLVQLGDEQISDPKLKKLKGYIVGTLNAYDVLAARGGTDAEKRAENRGQLLSAEGDRAINAALDVIQSESDIAHEASVEATRVPELQAQSSLPEVRSAAEYDKIPLGSQYLGPDGKTYTKRKK